MYSSPVRKFFWQRWALMLLLVTRLVIGELGYAMPAVHAHDTGAAHSSMAEVHSDAMASLASQGHDGHQPVSESHDAGHATADDASALADCCQSNECECPCMHVPCMALDALAVKPVTTALLRTPQGVENFISQRPSGLFRPPARFS